MTRKQNKRDTAVVAGFAVAAAAFAVLRPGNGWEGFAAEGLALSFGALLLAYLGMKLLALNGADEVLLRAIINGSQSRRGCFALACLLSAVFSASSELGCLISGRAMSDVGKRLGVSREKTALLVNMSSVIFRWLIALTFCVGPVLGYVRMGLDSAGGQDVEAAGFLQTTLVFLYFPICAAVMLIMSVFKLRDAGALLKAERDMRKKYDVVQLRNLSGTETSRSELAMAAAPPVLSAAALAVSLASGLNTPLAVLLSSAVLLFSAAAALLAGKGPKAAAALLAGKGPKAVARLLPLGFGRPLPLMLLQVLAAGLLLTFPAPLRLTGLLISEDLPLWLLPLATVLISGAIAFVTGSELIALALVFPSVIPAGWLASEQAVYYTMAAASAISGALAGYLCAPHAPASVISACACGCGLRVHMKTQIQYVLLVLGTACVFGYLPISLGLTAPFGLLCSIFGSYAVFETISSSPDTIRRGK